jgi:hypothetical protein
MTINTDQEYILCSAIWYKNTQFELMHQPKNIQFGMVLCGRRHHNIIGLYHCLTFCVYTQC